MKPQIIELTVLNRLKDYAPPRFGRTLQECYSISVYAQTIEVVIYVPNIDTVYNLEKFPLFTDWIKLQYKDLFQGFEGYLASITYFDFKTDKTHYYTVKNDI